jgi:hypothetical protein
MRHKSLDTPIISNEIESILRSLPTKKSPRVDVLTAEY